MPDRDTITGVISAKAGRFSDVDQHATDAISPGDRQVWAVVFSGTLAAGSCGPVRLRPETRIDCPPPATSILVIIDEDDGTFIEAMSPADARQ